jgi:hypothetical protein
MSFQSEGGGDELEGIFVIVLPRTPEKGEQNREEKPNDGNNQRDEQEDGETCEEAEPRILFGKATGGEGAKQRPSE